MPQTENNLLPKVESCVDLLQLRARDNPLRTAFVWHSDNDAARSHLTYAQLDYRARSLATRLLRTVGPGDRALLLYQPGLEFIEALFGAMYAGLVAVPVQAGLHRRDSGAESRLRSVVADARPAVMLTTGRVAEQVRHVLEELGSLQPRHRLLTDLPRGDECSDWSPPPIDRQTLALLQYTSGSTASPKGVMLTHGNLLANSAIIYRSFRHSPDSRGVIWLPPFHDMGLIGGILQPLYGGFPVTLMSPITFLINPLQWLQLISDTRATTSGGPDFAYELCVRRIQPEQRRKLDLSCWKVAFNGADTVHLETLERFAAAFAESGFRREAFVPCYGLAEATLMVTSTPLESAVSTLRLEAVELRERRVVEAAHDSSGEIEVVRLVSNGSVDTGPHVAIVDPDTCRPCNADEVGEIWIRGSSVAAGYWQQPLESERTFAAQLADGKGETYLRTGDLGFIRQGQLYFTGRLKELLIFAGRNHHPEDIERTVAQAHPWPRTGACAVFTVPATQKEHLAVAVELDRSHYRTLFREPVAGCPPVEQSESKVQSILSRIETEIRRAVSDRHGLNVYRVVFLKPTGLPRTPSGKVRRHACRAAYLAQSLQLVEDGQPCTH